MNQAYTSLEFATLRTPLSLYEPPVAAANTTRWRINGHRATVVIWTPEEWERLAERPTDAQYTPCGVWCALRVD